MSDKIPTTEELDLIRKLAGEAGLQRDVVICRYFKLQHAFYQEDIFGHPLRHYNPLKHKRLIGNAKDLLSALEEWQKLESEICSVYTGKLSKPPYDFPDNELTPQQIAAEFARTMQQEENKQPSDE